MTEWKEYKLKEIAQLEKNSWKVGDEKLPYIALEHIVEGGLRLQGIGDSNTIASNKFRFNSDCFLFGKLRPYFRKLFRPNFEGICSTDIWVVKPRGENDKDFLFYFFANQDFVDFTYSGSSGTRMPRADWNFVSESKWNFPPLPEQKAIASVLSSLDDKIDLLHRQNKTLEQMAETLFRQWFVEEADEGWEHGKLGDYVNIAYGKNLPTKQLLEEGYPVYGGNGQIGYYDNFLYKQPQVLVSCRGEASGAVNISEENSFVTNNSLILERTKRKDITFEFLKFFSLNTNFKHYVTGSAQPQITITSLSEADFVLPDKKSIKEFSEFVSGIECKRTYNQTQIRTLEKMRDTLLPKLMSGEIRVKMEE